MSAERRNSRIVRAYLERVSWKVLERWRPIVAGMIKGHPGVYALYKSGKLYYVGLASNLMGRVNHHLKDRHKGKWDRFSVYLTVNDDHIRALEALVLRVADVEGNRQKGRLGGAKDLARQVRREAQEGARDEAASLLGGRFIQHRRRQKIKSSDGVQGIKGLGERFSLRARYKGKLYRATLRRDGQISYRGKKYQSPSTAAKAILGRAGNGWNFWTYRNERREWVKLSHLRS